MKNLFKLNLISRDNSSKNEKVEKKTPIIKEEVKAEKPTAEVSNIIDGKALALKHENALAKKIKSLKLLKSERSSSSNKPTVVSILVGNDPASVLYVHMKQRKAQSLGINFELLEYPDEVTFKEVAEKINQLNKDKNVDGIMVQLPSLPGLTELISPKKDVDGLTGKGKYLPAAVKAVMSIFEDEKITLKGKITTIIGSSELVGKPIATQLKKAGAKITVCDIATRNLREETLKADILVSATGESGLVIGKMVKDGVIVIDVGTAVIRDVPSTQVFGDVDFESVAPKASKISPVPGGVGPMTVISLMENVVDAASKRK